MHGNFLNDQVFIDTLPQIEEVEFLPLESSYRYVLLFRALIMTGFLFLAYTMYLTFSFNWGFYYLVIGYGIVLLYGIIALILRYMGFNRKAYAVRNRDIIYRTGLLWKTETVVPFSRIQHCEIKQGPVDSLLDLSRLKVYTAGSSGSDLVIPGLLPEEAARIRKFIIQKTGLNEEE